GEEAGGEPEPRQHRDAALDTQTLQLGGIVLALDEVVFVLQHGEGREAVRRRDVMRLAQAGRVVVRGADLAHQALANERVEPPRHVFERRLRFVAVGVIEVDIVGPQPFERLGELVGHRLRGEVAGLAEHPGLGGNAHLAAYAARLQPLADHRLALAADVAGHPDRVSLRGVDHSPTVLVEAVEDREAGVLVGGEAEHVAAQDEWDSGDGPMVCHANFSRSARRAIAASAAPAPLLSCRGSARTIAWPSFSTVRMPFPTASPSMVSAMIPRALSPATISK